MEMYQGRYNIFAEPFIKNASTLKLLKEIGEIYFK